MDLFEFVVIFVSIILGLGLAHILQGVGRLLKDSQRCKFYWLHLTWVFILVLYYLDVWVMVYLAGQGPSSYTYLRLLLHFSFFGSLFVLTVLLFPDFSADSVVDLRQHFFNVHRKFFGVWAVAFVLWTLDSAVFHHELTWLSKDLFPEYAFIALAITGAVLRDERLHAVLPVLFLANVGLIMMR